MTTLERNAIIQAGPWILYDGTCGLCSGGATRLGPIVVRRGFRLTPLQSPIGRAFDSGVDEMQVITRRGKVVGGVEGAWVSEDPSDCATAKETPQVVAWFEGASGSVSWVQDNNPFPCVIDVDVDLTFPAQWEWVPTEVVMQATDLAVMDCG